MIRVFQIIIFFYCFNLFGQKFADKEFYLVDSLVYEKISPEYQFLIDNSLKGYHASETDMGRITWVNQIVKLCWDENVWPKYNWWVYEYSTLKLKEPQTDSVRIQLLQALAGSIYYIGWNYGVATQYDLCISYYEKCKNIYVEINDSIGIANTLDNIGSIYLYKGELAKALEYYTDALVIREKINDVLGTGASLNSIGTIYMEHGDLNAALNEYKRALVFYERVKFGSGISSVLNNLGSIHFYFGDYERAYDYFSRGLSIKTQLEDKQGMAISLTQIGSIRMCLGNYTEAMNYFERSLQLNTEIGDQRGVAGSLRSIGQVYLIQGKFKKALTYFNQCLTIAEETGAYPEKRNALESLFRTHLLQENFVAAEIDILDIIAMRREDVRINFTILPEQKKELYFNTMSEDFMNLYAFANLRKNENPEITEIVFNNTLKLKGILLKSTTALRESVLTSGDSELINKYTQWINLKKEIADSYANGSETENLENLANELEKELIKKSSVFNEFNKVDETEWKDIQAKLQPDEVAIEYIYFNSEIGNDTSSLQYVAMLINSTCEHPKMIDLCTSKQLEAILGTTQANNLNYIQRIYGTKQNPNHDLYELIWKPIENELISKRTVYISVTGLLHKISFSALSNEKNEFICDLYNLEQVSSTAQLVYSKPFEFSTNSTISLFGGVKYSTEKTDHVIWNYLPGSLTEIDSISQKLTQHLSVNYFNNENASEENFKSIVTQSNFIHIASHGFFYPDPDLVQKEIYYEESEENPDFRGGGTSYGIWNFVSNKNPLMRSGIALAGANDMWNRSVFSEGEDGVLTAQEVTTLTMQNTDLVVLSACETALGDIRGNEGVYGLQRAFKMAGVRYLIMSLWQVPDTETAEFMTSFYTYILKLKDIRPAFSKAQKEMRVKYDPYYWAAFVLVE